MPNRIERFGRNASRRERLSPLPVVGLPASRSRRLGAATRPGRACSSCGGRLSTGRIRSSAPTHRGQNCDARCPPQLGERLGRRPRGAVDPRRQHRVERVGDVDDAGAERDVLAPQAVRVAGAVEALVVVADRGHGVVQEAEAVDDPRALVGVPSA